LAMKSSNPVIALGRRPHRYSLGMRLPRRSSDSRPARCAAQVAEPAHARDDRALGSISSAVSPSDSASTGCARCDRLAVSYSKTRLRLRDRDREIAELRAKLE
jgi:hypothetical protein